MSRQNKNRNKRLVARQMSDKRILRTTRLDWKGRRHDPMTVAAAQKRESDASR